MYCIEEHLSGAPVLRRSTLRSLDNNLRDIPPITTKSGLHIKNRNIISHHTISLCLKRSRRLAIIPGHDQRPSSSIQAPMKLTCALIYEAALALFDLVEPSTSPSRGCCSRGRGSVRAAVALLLDAVAALSPLAAAVCCALPNEPARCQYSWSTFSWRREHY